MQPNFVKKIFCFLSLVSLLVAVFISPFHNAYAINEGAKGVTWDADSGKCEVADLKYNPLSNKSKELLEELEMRGNVKNVYYRTIAT